VNRFQHYQIELQERLRKNLGLPVDVPMRHGLADDAKTPAELMLHFHFRMLQAMDLISLALCCTNPPMEQIQNVIPRPGARALTINVRRESPSTLNISPWMFRAEVIPVSVTYRAVPARSFQSEQEFREAYRDANANRIKLDLRPA